MSTTVIIILASVAILATIGLYLLLAGRFDEQGEQTPQTPHQHTPIVGVYWCLVCRDVCTVDHPCPCCAPVSK